MGRLATTLGVRFRISRILEQAIMCDDNSEPTVYEHAEVVRKMWQHEDTIANHRITWFTTTQGLLFAALAIAFKEKATGIALVLFSVGIGSCLLACISLFLGARAKVNLQDYWAKVSINYVWPPVVGYYIYTNKYAGYFAPSNLLPILFGIGWVILAWDAKH